MPYPKDFPKTIDPTDIKTIGDVIVNTPLIDLRDLQEYLRQTYGVELIIKTPVDDPPSYVVGYAGGAQKGE